MYYIISSDEGGEPNVYIDHINNDCVLVQEGEFISDYEEAFIDSIPFEFSMKVRKNPDGGKQVARMQAYYDSVELMHIELVEALRKCGVDNLQTFPAVLRDEEGGKENNDYVVVNIVGLVECADLDKSDSMEFADGRYFNKLVIEEESTKGCLMFRLADSKMDVLVHEDVAKEIQGKFPYLHLTPAT